MPFLFSCPNCGTKTEVQDEFSGQSGECVTCGKQIQLPDFVRASRPGTGKSVAGRGNPSLVDWARQRPAVIAAGMVMSLFVICLGYGLVRYGGSAIVQLRDSQNRTISINNLQKIAKALNAYAEFHGTYPPPYTTDASGRPMLSWRVLILPFLDEDERFAEINLNAPWNSAENSYQAYNPPPVFSHPNHEGMASCSPYQLLVSQAGIFQKGTALGPKDLLDDPAKTILLVEANSGDFGQSWMEPTDLNMDSLLIDTSSFWLEVDGLDPEGMMVATVDEGVHLLSEDVSVMDVRALMTPLGGEPLPDDLLDSVFRN